HALSVARTDDFAGAQAVAVLQRPAENIGDDLHVLVGVHAEAATGGDHVFIHDPQGAELNVSGIAVIGERKSVIGIEPSVIEMPALAGGPHCDHLYLRAAFQAATEEIDVATANNDSSVEKAGHALRARRVSEDSLALLAFARGAAFRAAAA